MFKPQPSGSVEAQPFLKTGMQNFEIDFGGFQQDSADIKPDSSFATGKGRRYTHARFQEDSEKWIYLLYFFLFLVLIMGIDFLLVFIVSCNIGFTTWLIFIIFGGPVLVLLSTFSLAIQMYRKHGKPINGIFFMAFVATVCCAAGGFIGQENPQFYCLLLESPTNMTTTTVTRAPEMARLGSKFFQFYDGEIYPQFGWTQFSENAEDSVYLEIEMLPVWASPSEAGVKPVPLWVANVYPTNIYQNSRFAMLVDIYDETHYFANVIRTAMERHNITTAFQAPTVYWIDPLQLKTTLIESYSYTVEICGLLVLGALGVAYFLFKRTLKQEQTELRVRNFGRRQLSL